jgi:hypothetical protein
MFFQSAVSSVTTKYANADQCEFFAEPTTEFFGRQSLLIDWERAPRTGILSEEGGVPRLEVVESMERSLKEHANVWAELAEH